VRCGGARGGLPLGVGADRLGAVTNNRVELDLDEAGLSADLPRPESPADEVQQVPYRPVQFRDDDLPTALARSAVWLRRAQQWLGEPLDVIAIHLDYDDRAGSPYYEVKLLCNEEDLAGAPLALRRVAQTRNANEKH
jgi:hypothetical protein